MKIAYIFDQVLPSIVTESMQLGKKTFFSLSILLFPLFISCSDEGGGSSSSSGKIANGYACTLNNQCESGDCYEGKICRAANWDGSNGGGSSSSSGKIANGLACTSNDQCESGNCYEGKVCRTPNWGGNNGGGGSSSSGKIPNGQACTSNDQCESGNCYEGKVCRTPNWGGNNGGENSGSGGAGVNCGNGRIDEGEVCDGDLRHGYNCAFIGIGYTGMVRCLDDCSGFDESGCTPPTHLPTCGNGKIDEGELCDGAVTKDNKHYTCKSIFGPGSTGELKCASDCLSFDKSACTPAYNCGDGKIQINESCDTAYTNESVIRCAAYYGEDFEGLRSCNSMCRWDLTPCIVPDRCGNGQLDKDLGEECDPSAPQSYDKTCEDLRGPGSKGYVYCNHMCKFSFASCSIPPSCGNGQTDNGTNDRPNYHEVCDTTDLKGKSCASLGSGYSGKLDCLVNCSGFDYSDCEAPKR